MFNPTTKAQLAGIVMPMFRWRQCLSNILLLSCFTLSLSAVSSEQTFKAKLSSAQFDAIWSKRELTSTKRDSAISLFVFPENARKNQVKNEVRSALVNNAETWTELDSGFQYVLELSTALSLDIRADAGRNIVDIIPYANFWIDNSSGASPDVLDAQYKALLWNDKLSSLLSMRVYFRGQIVRAYYCSDDCPRGVSGWYHSNQNLIIDDIELDIPPRENDTDLRLHVYAIGAGNCTVIECPGSNEAIIADCGSTGDARYSKSMFPKAAQQQPLILTPPAGSTERPTPYEINFFLSKLYQVLKDKGEVTLILSHSDIDHYNYFEFLTHEFFGTAIISKLKALYAGGQFNQFNSEIDIPATLHSQFGNVAATKIYAMGENKDQPFTYVEKVRSVDEPRRTERKERWTTKPIYSLDRTEGGLLKTPPPSCGLADVDILAVNAEDDEWIIKNGTDPRSNQRSLILRVSYKGKSIILPGDATEVPLIKSIDNGIGHSTIVIAPHHGSGEEKFKSNLEQWINTVNPEYVVFSSGKSKHGHPNKTTYNRYRTGSRLLAADEHKFFVYESASSSSETVTSNKQIFSTYFDGTVVFTVSDTGTTNGKVTADCYGPFFNIDNPDDEEPEFNHWCSPLKNQD